MPGAAARGLLGGLERGLRALVHCESRCAISDTVCYLSSSSERASRRNELPRLGNIRASVSYLSALSSVATCEATSLANSAASPRVISPAVTAANITALASPTSAGVRKVGKFSATSRSRRGGKIRSKQIFSAKTLPSRASSIILRVSASASPSSNASAARVARWRAPLGFPAGLPDRPFVKGRPR